MNWLKDNKIYIFFIYVNILFILTLVKICYKIEDFSYIYITALFFAGFLVYWFCHSVLRKALVKVIFLVILLGSFGVFYIINSTYVNSLVTHLFIDKVIYINSTVAKALPTSFNDFMPILIITIPTIIFIMLFFTTKGISNIVLIFNLSIIITLWYFGYTEEIKKYLFNYIFVSMITYCMNTFLKNVKKFSKKGIKVGIDSYKIFIYILVASVIIAGITNFLPQDYKGQYTSDVKSKFYNRFAKQVESGEEKGKKLQFDLSYSGYDNNKKKLGGPVAINRLIAFRVQSDKNYYLKGTVKDMYDGFSWDQSDKKYNIKETEEERSLFVDGFSYPYLGNIANLIIHPEELNTTTMFTTNIISSAATDTGEIYYDNIPNVINSTTLRKPYNVYYYKINMNGENVVRFGKEEGQREKSIAYYYENFGKYLQIPDNISPRVYDLVYNLVKDKATNSEKLNVIKNYLKSNYPYSLEVSNIPEGQEFLDYFLFTEKRGYCTYFATAETIMCRIAGIPARYVEGFNMSKEKDENGLYVVRNENAHAWTEVLYVDENGTGLWYEVDAVPNAIDIVHKQEEEKKAQSNSTGTGGNTNAGMGTGKNVDGNSEHAGGSISSRAIPLWVFKVIYIILTMIILNLVLVICHLILKKKLLRSRSVIPIYKYSLKRLESIGINGREFIGDMEFIEKLPGSIKLEIKNAAQMSYEEYFGGKSPVKFNKEGYYKFIEDFIKKNQPKLQYFVKKYYFISKISFIKQKIVLLYKRINE